MNENQNKDIENENIENQNVNMQNQNANVTIKKKKTIFSPNKGVATVIYILMLFLFAGFISIGIALFLGILNRLDTATVLESLSTTDLSSYEAPYLKVNAIAQGWGNFLGYFIALVGVAFFMRDDIVTDFNALKEKKNYLSIYIPVMAVFFVVVTYLIDFVIGFCVPSSANQSTIEIILSNGGMLPMILATVLLAPVVEELIYRKVIFSVFKKYSIVACYIISIILFTLPHMISTNMTNFGVWLLQCVPYASSGALLCFIYHKSDHNVYASIAAHMANNLLACILVLIFN